METLDIVGGIITLVIILGLIASAVWSLARIRK